MNKFWGARRFGIGCLMAVFMVFGISPFARADTTITVQIGPLVTDVCPNILGIQSVVPSGMVIDTNGDCITPLPPVVDVCANIDGIQTTIPAGYYQDTSGNCLEQPTPPVDVCPNILGLQTLVPSGLLVDSAGNCVAPPVDECPNIAGPQSTIPIGMVKAEGICFTPVTDTTPTQPGLPPPAQNNTPSFTTHGGYLPPVSTVPDYKNVPEALDPVIDPLVKLVPEPIKEFAKSVPKQIAQTVPYYIFALLGTGAVILAVQALQEASSIKAILLLLKREKNLSEQKDNFIALASHYLRTPLTLMHNGLDTIVALKEADAATLEPLKHSLQTMDGNIKSILADIENNQALKSIQPPSARMQEPKLLRSGFFWGPVLGSIILTVLSNFLLGVVADVDLGTANLMFQVIVIVAVVMVFYSAVRNFYIHRARRKQQQKLLEYEHAVDEARNSFITQTTKALGEGLAEIYGQRYLIGNAKSARFFDEGYIRFNGMLEKFLLLSQIKSASIYKTEPLNLRDLVASTLKQYDDQLKEKQITVVNDIDAHIVTKQNRELFEFIMRSIIDNAVKFNTENGTITFDANKDTKQFTLSIRDTGIGIPKDKISQIFQPFSRADSALQFNYEGLGFSLFLDKIIADYIGGSIAAASSQTHGTNITVKTSLA